MYVVPAAVTTSSTAAVNATPAEPVSGDGTGNDIKLYTTMLG